MKRNILALALIAIITGCGVSPRLADSPKLTASYSRSFAYNLKLERQILDNRSLFPVVKGDVFAMNIQYKPILNLRQQISQCLKLNLDYLRSWKNAGEAHITVINPPEYRDVLSKYLDMAEIQQIAQDAKIQESDLEIVGLGSGQKKLESGVEQTFFVIVKSNDLLEIRNRVWEAYVRAGGPAKGWDPKAYNPHITVGFTKRDLHEKDGVIKDAAHALDKRFNLTL